MSQKHKCKRCGQDHTHETIRVSTTVYKPAKGKTKTSRRLVCGCSGRVEKIKK